VKGYFNKPGNWKVLDLSRVDGAAVRLRK